MGVRISIYAYNASALMSFLEKPVSEVLRYYVKNGTAAHSSILINDKIRGAYFHATVDRGIIHNGGREPLRPATEKELAENPVLRRSAIEVFSEDNEIVMRMLLGCLSSCPSLDFIKEITEGHRIWWVKSFLEGIKNEFSIPLSDKEAVAKMLSRLISRHDRANNSFGIKKELRAADFPAVPEDIEEYNVSVWTKFEIEVLLVVIRPLLESSKLCFRRPRGSIGTGPESDKEWNDWVYQMLRQLLKLKDMPFRPLRTINFMG